MTVRCTHTCLDRSKHCTASDRRVLYISLSVRSADVKSSHTLFGLGVTGPNGTGQSFADWTGGAPAYLAQWYDQSNNSNTITNDWRGCYGPSWPSTVNQVPLRSVDGYYVFFSDGDGVGMEFATPVRPISVLGTLNMQRKR